MNDCATPGRSGRDPMSELLGGNVTGLFIVFVCTLI